MFVSEGGDAVVVSHLTVILRRPSVNVAPALERLLLMLIRAEESHS